MNPDYILARPFPTRVAGNGFVMPGRMAQEPPVAADACLGDARVSLLAEVDFKWLMAGQGWWIDMTRFHSDLAYAAAFIRFAMASPSFVLRDCAAFMQSQMGEPACGEIGSPASDAVRCGSPVVEVCKYTQT